jgi:hypothetical protein
MRQAQEKGEQVASQFIDNENMLMVTGQISDEANRKLLITKATASGHVKSVNILRSPQLIEQYGAGMSGQQATDDIQRKVMETKQSSMTFMNNDAGDPVLRIVTPYLLSKDFHGTDCTGCHAGGEGAVSAHPISPSISGGYGSYPRDGAQRHRRPDRFASVPVLLHRLLRGRVHPSSAQSSG